MYCDPVTRVSNEGSGRFRCFRHEHVQPAARLRINTHRKIEREREQERERERQRKGLQKTKQTLGRQEAAVPEVAATAEAQSVLVS